MSMSQRQALVIVQKKHGKHGAVRDSGRRSSQLQRDYHREQIAALGKKPEDLNMWDQAFPDTMTLGEYRGLVRARRAEENEWRNERDKHVGKTNYRRYAVGRLGENLLGLGRLFFTEGEGDTWEEALANAKLLPPAKPKRAVPTCKKCQAEHWPFQTCA